MTTTEAIAVVRANLREFATYATLLGGLSPAERRYHEAVETLIAVACIVATSPPTRRRKETPGETK
jgi:hypothetical protein